MLLTENLKPNEKVLSPEKAAKIMTDILLAEKDGDEMKEHFWVMGLDAKYTIVYIELVSLGMLNACIVHPREVFRMAITKSVNTIIVCHNHPSNDPTPSEEDIRITTQLKESGDILAIQLSDHIIITADEKKHTSMAGLGHI